jgi:hypothetical protein
MSHVAFNKLRKTGERLMLNASLGRLLNTIFCVRLLPLMVADSASSFYNIKVNNIYFGVVKCRKNYLLTLLLN